MDVSPATQAFLIICFNSESSAGALRFCRCPLPLVTALLCWRKSSRRIKNSEVPRRRLPVDAVNVRFQSFFQDACANTSTEGSRHAGIAIESRAGFLVTGTEIPFFRPYDEQHRSAGP